MKKKYPIIYFHRTPEKKRKSYDAISSLLSDIDLPLQENMDALRRAFSDSTRSTVSEDPIYDNVLNECDYMNAESFRKSQAYIDVDELEQKAMYLNYEQMQKSKRKLKAKIHLPCIHILTSSASSRKQGLSILIA